MKPRHQVSRAAIELIKRFEGYRRQAAQLPDGRWTIGYGHTLTAREGVEVSEADAEALLLYDMIGVAHTVSELTYAPLTRNQFDALCAFAFSIGLEAFRRSDVLKRVNEGALTEAAFALELWRKAEFEGERIVIDALVRRRAAEKLLFLTPPGEAWRAAPSAILRPELDEDAPLHAPRQPPVDVEASLQGQAVEVRRLDDAAGEAAPAPPTHESPVTAAAEAVTARLQTLYPEPQPEPPQPETPQEPAAGPEVEAGAEGEGEPELSAEPAAEALPEPVEPRQLHPAEPASEAVVEAPEAARPDAAAETIAAPEPANAAVSGDKLPPPPAAREPGPMPRILIDDTAPFEFVPPVVEPLPMEVGDGVLAIVSLSVLGIAFFAGGVFWALNAQGGPQSGVFTPLLVGWLAGVAGVGFIASAVFLLLHRMNRAAERRDRRERGRI